MKEALEIDRVFCPRWYADRSGVSPLSTASGVPPIGLAWFPEDHQRQPLRDHGQKEISPTGRNYQVFVYKTEMDLS